MSVLSSKYLVICDGDELKGVNVLDISSLPNIHLCDSYLDLHPYDVTVINEEKIAVTEPDKKQIQFLSVVKGKIGLSKEETLRVSRSCFGIDNDGQHLFVTTKNKDEVLILDFKGNVLKTMKGFREPIFYSFLTYDFTNSSLYIFEWLGHNFTHITTDGKVKSVISNIPFFSSLVSDSKKYLYLATRDGIVQLNSELSEATVLYEVDTFRCLIACSKPGDLYVIDLETRKLHVFRFEEGTKSPSGTQAND